MFMPRATSCAYFHYTLHRSVAAKKWGKDVPILTKIIDIESEHQHQKENRQYIVIGTLYKDMHLRGSVSLSTNCLLQLMDTHSYCN